MEEKMGTEMMTGILCIGIISLIFFGELRLKNEIEENLEEKEERFLCKGNVRIHKFHNRGAALGYGHKRPKVIVILTILMTVFATGVFLFSLGQKGNHLFRIGMAVLLGGAFSNAYDRLCRKYVVDYVSFPLGSRRFRKVVFNISDFCIMIGAVMAVLGSLKA